ncbi:MAG: GDP-mannose 4,6-dehydratase, partial [Myxococcaceae bacterium]|nr:GDP-mannose 4,6-dehydratase [Myxococcaceae bacterium]
PSFAAQVQAITRGRAPPVLRVGDLAPVRDFSHVADVVRAYRLLLQRGVPGEAYNVCSGESRSIRSLLDALLCLAGVEARVEVDPARLRPVEIPTLSGSPAKLEALGWRQEHTLDQALMDVLEEAAVRIQ